jgi:SAM-dependent methyltransferase
MPLVLDVHSLDDPVALSDVTRAHDADLRTQGPYGVSYLRYWVDETAGKIFCLVDAPSADVAADVHREAHGLVAQEIYQVTEGGADPTIEHESSPDEHPDHAPAEAWDAIAAGYAEHVAPGEQRISALALDLVGLRADESFLDVAAGPGGLGLAAARSGATVLATDWSPAMLAQFEAKLRSEGLANASGRVMDAHALDLENDSFDVTGSQFGVMLVPDQAVALREMVRVTKPGGRVLLIAYGSPAEFDALQLFIAALQTVVPEFEGLPDPPPLEFQVSDPAVLRARLVAAGLSEVQVDTTQQERVEVSTGQQVWDWMLYSNPITDMILEDVAEAERAKLRRALDDMIRDRADTAGLAVLTAPLNIGWGQKPGGR